MNPFQMVRDWNEVKRVKKELLDFLRRTPAGAGISVEGGLTNPIMARALIEILNENPTTIEAMDNGSSITLMRKVSMVQTLTGETYQHLRGNHQILSADSIHEFGLKNKDQLPTRKWRDGVPDDVNDAGPQVLQPTTLVLEKP